MMNRQYYGGNKVGLMFKEVEVVCWKFCNFIENFREETAILPTLIRCVLYEKLTTNINNWTSDLQLWNFTKTEKRKLICGGKNWNYGHFNSKCYWKNN